MAPMMQAEITHPPAVWWTKRNWKSILNKKGVNGWEASKTSAKSNNNIMLLLLSMDLL
jgi:hypothetical protein